MRCRSTRTQQEPQVNHPSSPGPQPKACSTRSESAPESPTQPALNWSTQPRTATRSPRRPYQPRWSSWVAATGPASVTSTWQRCCTPNSTSPFTNRWQPKEPLYRRAGSQRSTTRARLRSSTSKPTWPTPRKPAVVCQVGPVHRRRGRLGRRPRSGKHLGTT